MKIKLKRYWEMTSEDTKTFSVTVHPECTS